MEALKPQDVHYPESDGERMAENTLQYRWIVTLQGNLDRILPDFVAGDLLWYPIEGDPKTRVAPDVMVALGRPKGDRGSYRQWDEGGVAPQVVFEVLSPGNTLPEMMRKLLFYHRHGVREFYVLDPEVEAVTAWHLGEDGLFQDQPFEGLTSPLLGLRFTREEGALVILGPDGARFLTFQEMAEQMEAARAQASEAESRAAEAASRASEAESRASEAESRASEAESRAAEAASRASEAESRAAEAASRAAREAAEAEAARQRIAELEARLKALG